MEKIKQGSGASGQGSVISALFSGGFPDALVRGCARKRTMITADGFEIAFRSEHARLRRTGADECVRPYMDFAEGKLRLPSTI